jgi:hypothetical protein
MLKFANQKLTQTKVNQLVAKIKHMTKDQIKKLKLPASVKYKNLKLVQRNDGYKYSYS